MSFSLAHCCSWSCTPCPLVRLSSRGYAPTPGASILPINVPLERPTFPPDRDGAKPSAPRGC